MKRLFTFSLVLLLLLGMLAGCGTNDDTPKTPSSDEAGGSKTIVIRCNEGGFGVQWLYALADAFDKAPGSLYKACKALGGHPIVGGDEAYAVEVMDGLEIGIFFWHADEEFPAQLRFFWDENATMYLKYETMHFAKGMLLEKLAKRM